MAATSVPSQAVEYAAAALAQLVAEGQTLASAESLTGGLVGAAITSVPGASAAYVGGVLSYATRIKAELLGVDDALVAEHGVVSEECAAAMAQGVRVHAGADWGVATTGVAGPDLQEGKPAGQVHVAVAGPDTVRTRTLQLAGDRREIRESTVTAVLQLLVETLGVVSPEAEGEVEARE